MRTLANDPHDRQYRDGYVACISGRPWHWIEPCPYYRDQPNQRRDLKNLRKRAEVTGGQNGRSHEKTSRSSRSGMRGMYWSPTIGDSDQEKNNHCQGEMTRFDRGIITITPSRYVALTVLIQEWPKLLPLTVNKIGPCYIRPVIEPPCLPVDWHS